MLFRFNGTASYAKYRSSVSVFKGGNPYSGARVALSFTHGGMTPNFYTDNRGQCEIEHAGRGTAKLFVNGREIKTVTAPGTFSAHL